MILNSRSFDIPSHLSPWVSFHEVYVEFFTLVLEMSIYSIGFFFRISWEFGFLLIYPVCVLVIHYFCCLICMCTYNAFIIQYCNMFLPMLLTTTRLVFQSLAYNPMCWSTYFLTTNTELLLQYSHLSITDKSPCTCTKYLTTIATCNYILTLNKKKIKQYVWQDGKLWKTKHL